MRLERCKEILCWQCVTGCSMSWLIARNTKGGYRFMYFVQHLTAGLHWCLLRRFFVLLCGQIQDDLVPESAKTDTKSLLCDTFCVVGRIDENGIFVNEWPGSYAEFTADSAFFYSLIPEVSFSLYPNGKNETVEIKKVVSERYPVEYFPDFVCFGGRQYGVKTHDNVDILLQNAKESIRIKKCNVLNSSK